MIMYISSTGALSKANSLKFEYQGLIYYKQTRGYVYSVINGVKHKDSPNYNFYVSEIANFLAPQVENFSYLIPSPQHTGRSIYTLDICQKIQQLNSDKTIIICDILQQTPREELKNLKKTITLSEIKSINLNMSFNEKWEDVRKSLNSCENLYFVDNTIDTGKTFDSVKKLFPNIKPLVFSISNKFLTQK